MKLEFSTEKPAFRERAMLKDLAARRRVEAARMRLTHRLSAISRSIEPVADLSLAKSERHLLDVR